MNSSPFWAWHRDRPADHDPVCQAALAALQRITAGRLAGLPGLVEITGSEPGYITVRTGGAEIGVMLTATGVTEKTCAWKECGKAFWRSESGSPAARYCSQDCASAAGRARRAAQMRVRRAAQRERAAAA
jgi:hypothetical protein